MIARLRCAAGARSRSALLAALLAGCGGPPAPTTPRTGDARHGEPSDGCPGDRARLGEGCWSAAGTRWHIDAAGPAGAYRFELELLAAGRARATDHEAASPGSDEWFQQGRSLRVFLADRFVEYRARVTNGTVLIGEARNVRGARWAWTGRRDFGEEPCREAEARLGDACMTLTGTRWWLEEEDTMIEFLRGGRLGTGGRRADDEAAGTWEQRGEALRFELEREGRSYSATIGSEDVLGGTWTATEGEGRWRASRVPSIPPEPR